MGHAKELVGILAEAGREVLPGWRERYTARHLSDPEEIRQARRLAAETFVRLGALVPEELDEGGLPRDDPWYPSSEYFGTYDGRGGDLVATGRLIWEPAQGVEATRLPLAQIDPAQAERLQALRPGATAEIGSLVKRDGAEQVAVLKLIREMWQFATDNRIDELTCGLKPKVLPRYQQLFGAALTNLATAERPHVEYPGVVGPQVPLSIAVLESFAQQRDQQPDATLAQRMERLVVRHFITVDNLLARGQGQPHEGTAPTPEVQAL